MDSHVHSQLHLEILISSTVHTGIEIIGADLVEVFLITESAWMHKAALMPILAMLQCLVIPVLLTTHRADIPETKTFGVKSNKRAQL